MREIKCFSMLEVLLTPAIEGNKTRLAALLGCNRGTVALYKKDTDMANHVVFSQDGKWVLRCGRNT